MTMSSFNRILLDADILTYAIGFASQKTYYTLYMDDGMVWEYTSIREAKKMCGPDDSLVTRVESMPTDYVKDKLSKTINKIKKETGCDKLQPYLTGKNNFRIDTAVTVPYKGNRKLGKPEHYKFIRQHLVDEYGAVIVDGEEADDALGIEQSDNTIIASIDKDLLMIPGWHYNLNTGNILEASDPGELKIDKGKLTGYGFKWFCAQMLLGDNVDNIKGVKGLGDVRTYQLLAPIEKELDLWKFVRNTYKKHKMSMDRLDENAQLLWIRREPNQHPYKHILELTK